MEKELIKVRISTEDLKRVFNETELNFKGDILYFKKALELSKEAKELRELMSGWTGE